MKATKNASVQGRIIKCFSISCYQCHNGGQWGGTWLGTIHFGFCKKISNVSALSKIETCSITYDFNAQEKTERTKVSDSKFLMQPLNDICDNKIIRTSDDNVININEDVDDARGVCVYKE